MGRYDRESGRYSQFKSKSSNRVPTLVAFILTICGALAGYFARPFIDSTIQPLTHWLSLSDEASKSNDAPQPPRLSAAISEIENIQPITTAPATFILPELSSSDTAVRLAITNIAPELQPWLTANELLRKFMLIANDFSQGLRINKHFEFLKLPQPFKVEANNEGIFMSQQSYQRYNSLAQAIDRIPVEPLLNFYQTFKPLLQQVFTEFSYPENFTLEKILDQAGTEILSAPIIEEPIPIIKHMVHFQYADPQLEALNPVKKQLLRMGPENTKKIQDKVRVILEKLQNQN